MDGVKVPRAIPPSPGFTLIELMVVIAIIAIIAAIAIPNLINSQRGSNERNASASLKTLATASHDFRANDRDGNKVTDFWTRDVSGLYTAFPPGATSAAAVKLIDISVAAADSTNVATQATTASGPGTTVMTGYMLSSPKAGYWYYALASDMSAATAASYAADTDGSGRSWHNVSTFAFGTFPDSATSGRYLYIINESSVMFKRLCISNCRSGTSNPPASRYPMASGVATSADDPANWPTDASINSNYGKMD